MRMRGRTVGVLAPCEAHASRAREAGKGRPGRVAEAATERAGRRGREGGREGVERRCRPSATSPILPST